MNPRLIIKTAAAAAGCYVAASAAAERQRPNILLIIADDLGWMDLGCQGSTFYKTPNIDRLAAEGMRFTDAYAHSTCSPTRAAIMTGKSAVRLHLTNPLGENDPVPKSPAERGKDWPWNRYVTPLNVQGLPLEEITVAERLKAAGYDTAIFGKWHLGGKGFEPEKQGFDVNVGAGHYAHPKTYFSPYKMNDVLSDGPAGEYLTDRLTDEAVRYISTPRKNPFFVYMAHYAPHTPIQGKPDKTQKYEKAVVPGNPHFNAEYAAMIESLDESVGRLMDALKTSGQDGNTLVFFVSDNGGVISTFGGNERITSNLPLRSGKGTLWEGGVRVPMIARWPGVIPASAFCDVPVTCEDFYPTFCEAAGVPVRTGAETEFDGESLLTLLQNPSAALRRDILCRLYPHYNQFTDACSSIRKGDLKLLRFYGGPVRLFDLRKDPGESNDISAGFPELVSGLSAQMDAWLKRVGAWEMVPNPQYNPRFYQPGIYEGFDPVRDGAVPVAEWNFEKDAEGWRALRKCGLSVRDGRLIVDSRVGTVSMEADCAMEKSGTYVLEMKVRETGIRSGACVLFWAQEDRQYVPQRRMQFALPHDDSEHVIAALFRVNTSACSIRLDPAMMAGAVEFDWIRIYRTDLP